jgi:hypothetical protein
MTAVLRIALSFFAIVPLQRWMNWIAVILLAFALLNLGNDGVLILAIPAMLLLVMVPAMSGGVALRYACTPSLLHLRPHGRLRLLIGATLTITLLAAIVALPLQIDAWSRELGSAHRPAVPSPFFVFQVAWSIIALSWLLFFALSRSQLAYAMFGLAPVLAFMVSRHVFLRVDHLHWLMPGALLLWVAFGLWLMRARHVERPAVMPSGASSDTNPFGWVTDLMPSSSGTSARVATSLHLLAGGTPMFVVNGIWIALIFMLVHFGMGRMQRGQGPGGTLFMMPFLAIMFSTVGYMIARRARLLWLRAGLDRAALFRQGEVLGLRAMGITRALPAAASVLAVAARDDRPLTQLCTLHVLPASGLAAMMFYGGMAMTRGLCVRDALLALALGSLFIVELVLLHPLRGLSSLEALISGVVAVAVIALLRLYALRSWQRLDWRVAKMPPPARRTA